jgi:cytochrome oxidase assembly protein ShyY1
MYWTWWRMPEEEYSVYHRFKPYYILGQLDYSKEILIPKTRNGQAGFNVVNPLYCYEGGKVSMAGLMNDGDSVRIERAAVIVNRGWIPANLRDKRSRPTEINTRQLVKLNGCFRPGVDVHKYTAPNDPTSNEWNNMSLEDIGIFWDIPNYQEAKYYYFQAIDL